MPFSTPQVSNRSSCAIGNGQLVPPSVSGWFWGFITGIAVMPKDFLLGSPGDPTHGEQQSLLESTYRGQAGERGGHPLCWGGRLASPKSQKRFVSPDLPHPSFLMLMSLTTAYLLNHKHGKIPEVASALKKINNASSEPLCFCCGNNLKPGFGSYPSYSLKKLKAL